MPPKNPWVLPDGFDDNVKKAVAEIRAAFANAKKSIPKEALQALQQGNYQAFLVMIDWTGISSGFGGLQGILQSAATNGAVSMYRKAGVGAKLTFDIIDEYSVNWASNQTGYLIKNITEEMRLNIQRTITEATMGDLTWQEASEQISEYIPLTERDAKAVAKYHDRMMKKYIDRKGWKEKEARKYAKSLTEAYAEKLTRSRANTIARTEIANAATQGEYIGWEAGMQSGMLDSESRKEWIAEPNACEYCHAMDGKIVAWDAEFPIFDGKLMPPAHPNCRCATAMIPPEYADTEFTAQALQKSKGWWDQFEIEFTKHLAGKHDQSNHGKGGSGAALKLPEVSNNFVDIANTKLSSTKPYVGLSDKAKSVRDRISEFDQAESIDVLGRKVITSTAIYKDKNDVKYKIENVEIIDAEGYSDSKATIRIAELNERVELGFLNHSSIGDKFLDEPSPDFKINRISGIAVNTAFQRLGIGTAMLEVSRMSSPNAVVHSGQRSDDGDSFSAATKSALTEAILKHLAGKHDQSTHGRGKNSKLKPVLIAGKVPELDAFLKANPQFQKFASHFDSDRKAQDYVNSQKQEVYDKMTPAQKSALETYTGGNFAEVNGVLRTGSMQPEALAIRQNVINPLDTLVRSSTLSEDMILTRGIVDVNHSGDAVARQYLGLNEGDEWTESGFTSTSAGTATAQMFASAEEDYSGVPDGVIMHINMPSGSAALPVHETRSWRTEAEYILPIGQRFRVVGKVVTSSTSLMQDIGDNEGQNVVHLFVEGVNS